MIPKLPKKKLIGTKYIYELEYVYLNRTSTAEGMSPFVSQVHPVECDKDGVIKEGIVVDLERVHNAIQWGPNNRTVIAPGWVWRNERIIEVPLYEKVEPLN